MEENVRINITGDNSDALKKLDKVEQAVNRLNSTASRVEVRVANIKQTQTEVDNLYQSLQRLENIAIQKLPQSLQTIVVYLKAANKGMAELTARAATAVSLVTQLGVIDFTPTIRQLKAASDRVDELIKKRRFLQGQVKSIDIRIERGRIKKPEAIERAREEQNRLRQAIDAVNSSINEYNSRAITGYRAQSSALRAIRSEYEAVRNALVSLRIEQARIFQLDQKRLRQQGDLPGTPQRKKLPPAAESAISGFSKALQDLTKIVYVSVAQIGRIWTGSRLLPPTSAVISGGSQKLLPPGRPGGALASPATQSLSLPETPRFSPSERLRGSGVVGVNSIRRLEMFRAKLIGVVKTAEIGSIKFQTYSKALGRVNKAIDSANRQISSLQADSKTIKGKRAQAADLSAALEEAEIGSKTFDDLARSLGKVNAEIERTEKRVSGKGTRFRGARQRFGDAASGAILGGGFPLLTGGPSFSAAGGVILGRTLKIK